MDTDVNDVRIRHLDTGHFDQFSQKPIGEELCIERKMKLNIVCWGGSHLARSTTTCTYNGATAYTFGK